MLLESIKNSFSAYQSKVFVRSMMLAVLLDKAFSYKNIVLSLLKPLDLGTLLPRSPGIRCGNRRSTRQSSSNCGVRTA